MKESLFESIQNVRKNLQSLRREYNAKAGKYSELMRDMLPGQVLRRQDIRPSVLVKKGQMVSFQVGQSANFMITATVQALQDGRMGEQIRLKNPESGRSLTAVVTGLNMAKGL